MPPTQKSTLDFVGRRREIDLLEEAYQKKQSAFIPVYGRRRVGKSELIVHFMKGKKGIYLVGKESPAPLQLKEFLAEAARTLDEPLLAKYQTESWKDALQGVVSRWKGPGKIILVLDEFQWLAQASPELPSVIQQLWDREWQHAGNVMLILCGSFIGFMEKEVLGRKSPLFGRRTNQILLRPFGYQEARAFHPNYSITNQARAYFFCGGIPLYHNFFDSGKSVTANVIESFLFEFAPLFREAEFLLREELREVERYYAILDSVACGKNTYKEISRHLGIGQSALTYYIEGLVELGYIARRSPLDGTKKKNRPVRFAIEDPVLRFWFRFIHPNRSFLVLHGGEAAWKELVEPEIEAYYGYCFERLCREALPQLYLEEKMLAGFTIGEYWDKKVQVDVVGMRSDHWTDLAECKWGGRVSAPAVVRELEEKAAHYPNPENTTIGLRLFTRGKLSGVPDHVKHHTLADMYAAGLS